MPLDMTHLRKLPMPMRVFGIVQLTLSLCVYGFFGLTANISWLTGRHSLFATPPLSPGTPLSPAACQFYLVQLIECGPNTY